MPASILSTLGGQGRKMASLAQSEQIGESFYLILEMNLALIYFWDAGDLHIVV